MAAVIAAYAQTFSVPFLLDDVGSVIDNPSIRTLTKPGEIFSPPASVPTRGRPLANFTFALSYALSGLDPWGYHLINLLIHATSALVLFGVVRRTLQMRALQAQFGESAWFLSTAIAMIWAVHPLLTQSVTYVSQRTEILMALFYLLTLYCFIRGVAEGRRYWFVFAIASCLLGALSKEVVVTAPLIVLLYDRTFVSGSFFAALCRRLWLYGALFSSWVVLAVLMHDLHTRGVGGDLGVSRSAYALTQAKAIVIYVSRSLWPHPLIFDYSPTVFSSFAAALPFVMIAGLLIGGATFAVFRWPAAGFALAWFFVLLVPTSSFFPIIGAPIAENRPYLPSAGIVALVIASVHAISGRRFCGIVCVMLALAGIFATHHRNRVYQDPIQFWSDGLARATDNYRAHHNLAGVIATVPSRQAEAVALYEAALRLKPDAFETHLSLANLLVTNPARQDEGVTHYEAAIRINPGYSAAYNNLALFLAGKPGRVAEARSHYETAIRLNPDYAIAHVNLADLWAGQPGNDEEAIRHYETALRLTPKNYFIHNKLGHVLARQPASQKEALAHFETALRLNPNLVEAHVNLGKFFALQPAGRAEALAHFERALKINPDHLEAHYTLGLFLAGQPARQAEAIKHYETTLRLNPRFAEAHANLAELLAAQSGREMEAVAHYENALELKPDYVEALNNLGDLLGREKGREREALALLETALRLSPSNAIIHFNIGEQLEKIPERRSEALGYYATAARLNPNLAPAREAVQRLEQARR